MSHFHIPTRITAEQSRRDVPISFKNWLAVAGASLAAFMAVLDIQVSNASMREIQGSLGLDMTEGGWISTSYLIAETIMIPLTGFLSQVFGTKRFVLFNCFIFILSSVLCGFSWNLPSMIAFRSLQGLSGGALVPMAFQILLIYIPKEKRHLSMVIFGITATLAPTIGPSMGGWLTDQLGWRYIFFINVAPGIAMMYLIFKGIDNENINWKKFKEIDLIGIFSLALGLGTLVFILEDGAKKNWFEDHHIQYCTLISIAALTIFLVSQLVRRNPLLHLGALRDKNFMITIIITMVSGAGLYGGIYSLSLYLGQIQNYTASEIGSVIMWLGVPQFIVMPFLPFLMKRVNLKLLTAIGILLFAYSNYLNAFMDVNYAGEQVRWSLFIRAIGQPLFMIPISVIGMSLIDHNTAGNASSLFNMVRNIGGSIGVSIAGTFLISRQYVHQQHIVSKLELGQTLLYEYLLKMEMGFRSMGFDVNEAKRLALKLLNGISMRDSFIQSFNDIFLILASALAFLVVLIMFLKPIQNQDSADLAME